MMGRNLNKHSQRLNHSYQSYCIVTQPSVFTFFGRASTISQNKTNEQNEDNKELENKKLSQVKEEKNMKMNK